jgi:2OG-Fe(II) oxygenase superfamily
MINVSLKGLTATAQEVATCRAEYERSSMLVLPGLFDEAVCSAITEAISKASWSHFAHDDHGDIGTEEVCDSELALSLLCFVICEPKFIAMIRQITGDDAITWFRGRIFRMNPSLGHHDSWHDDANGQRRVGMSVCLESVPCQGGGFELRKCATQEILGRVEKRNLGDATLFRIGDDLEHRVLPVNEGSVRIAYAGWFRADSADLGIRLADIS